MPQNSDAILDQAKKLREGQQAVLDVETRKWKRVMALIFITLCFDIILTTVGGYTLFHLAQQNHKNGKILIDCTTPSFPPKVIHICYDRGVAAQTNTINAIATNTRNVNIFSVECAFDTKPFNDAGFEKCIASKINTLSLPTTTTTPK